MDFSSLLLGAVMAALPLIGAGLLAAFVLLERPEQLAPATGPAPRRGKNRRGKGRRAR